MIYYISYIYIYIHILGAYTHTQASVLVLLAMFCLFGSLTAQGLMVSHPEDPSLGAFIGRAKLKVLGPGRAWWGHEEIESKSKSKNASSKSADGHLSTCKFECQERGCVFFCVLFEWFSAQIDSADLRCLWVTAAACFDPRPAWHHRHDGHAEDPSKKADFTVKPSAFHGRFSKEKLQPCRQS